MCVIAALLGLSTNLCVEIRRQIISLLRLHGKQNLCTDCTLILFDFQSFR